MIFPEKLKKGDKIAVISPATVVKEEFIDGALEFLRREGFEPVVMPHAKGPAAGTYAANEYDRASDLRQATLDPEVKAILCARGGYGCVHLLSAVTDEEIRANAKWLIGFSDVSALHAMWHRAGVASIHGPMAKHMTEEGDNDFSTRSLINLLTVSPSVNYKVNSHPLNLPGRAFGRLLGGNLAVLDGLAATDLDMLTANDAEGTILFMEDIAEPIYKVERMLSRLAMSGALSRAKGLVFGQFTEYKPSANYEEMEWMVSDVLSRHRIKDIPVAFRFPVGHVKENLPLVEGDYVELRVTPEYVSLNSMNEPMTPPVAPDMTLREAQAQVDHWIRTVGRRYFSELTNMALLTEETGELARVIARVYGDQVAKEGDLRKGLEEEMADIFWVLSCLANQTGVDLTTAFRKTLEKKNSRDKDRFK